MTVMNILFFLILPSGPDLYTVENGKIDEKPSLLFINGLGQDTTLWQALIERLESDWHCVRFDFPGIGKSPSSTTPLTLNRMAELCRNVLDQKKLKKVHVIGLSLGSFTAQTFASKYPERVEKLILIGSSMGGTNHVPPTDEALAFLMGQSGLEGEAKIKKGLELSLSQLFIQTHPEELKKTTDHYLNRSVDQNALTQQIFAGMSFDVTGLNGFKGEILIIHGDEDQLIPMINAQKLHKTLSGSQLIILKHSGHLCPVDQAEKVAEAINRFL